MITKTVYEELVYTLIQECRMNAFEARKVVNFLKNENLIDYDTLKEYYDSDIEDQ